MKEFGGFGAFAAHLVKLSAVGAEVVHHAADKAGEVIEKTAKDEIGHYQEAAGPFPAWAPLAESTESEKKRLGYPESAPLLRTGAMRESISRKTQGHESVVGSSDQKMIYHELGTSKMPPRPVLGLAAYTTSKKVKAMLGQTAFAWLAGRGWKRPQKLTSE